MPVYEFSCASCGHRFEEFTWSSADGNTPPCPGCGAAETRKLMSVFGIGRVNGTAAERVAAGPSAPCGPGCACHAGAVGRTPSMIS